MVHLCLIEKKLHFYLETFISFTRRQLSAWFYFQEVLTYYSLGKSCKPYFCYFVRRYRKQLLILFRLSQLTVYQSTCHLSDYKCCYFYDCCSPAFAD